MAGDLPMLEERLAALEAQVAEINGRNRRVEGDKAWETSLMRRLLVAGFTYVFAGLLLYLIGSRRYFLDALIPTAGYVLSTLSVGVAKRRWLAKRGSS